MKGESLNGRLRALVGELASKGVTLDQARKEFEKQFILASLRLCDGNYSRSAKSLGVHRNTLRNKLATLDIRDSEVADIRSEPRPGRQRSARS